MFGVYESVIEIIHTAHTNKLHNELNDLYSSPSIVWVIKLRRLRWTRHVVHMGERRGEVYAGLWWENPRERDHLENPGVDGRIILR